MLATSEVQAFRESLTGLTALTVEDLQLLWAAWPWDDPATVTQLAVDLIPDVVVTYARTASGLAVDQYDTWRASEGVRGGYRATVAEVAAWDQIVAGVRNGVSPLWAAIPDVVSAQSLLEGSAVRHVMHGANDTIIQSVRRDPQAVGWARHARPGACPFCQMLADRGAVYRKQETVSFRSHDNCVPGGTLILSPEIEVAYRRRFEGELVVIRTAGMRELAVTPNHPVLTRRGWVPAGLLHESDQIVVSLDGDRVRSGVPYVQGVPASAEEIWDSLQMDRLVKVPSSAEQFHGDVSRGDHDVDVIATDSFLASMNDSVLGQVGAEQFVRWAGRASVSAELLRFRSVGNGLVRSAGSTDSVMGRSRQLLSLFGSQFGHAQEIGVRSGSDWVSGFGQPSDYDVSRHSVGGRYGEDAVSSRVFVGEPSWGRDGREVGLLNPRRRFDPPMLEPDSDGLTTAAAKLGCDLGERLTGFSESDSVAYLGRRKFYGHVYNFQTSEGWYSADGVVVSNCRCSTGPSWDQSAPKPVEAQYRASRKNPSPKDRERLKQYLADNYPNA